MPNNDRVIRDAQDKLKTIIGDLTVVVETHDLSEDAKEDILRSIRDARELQDDLDPERLFVIEKSQSRITSSISSYLDKSLNDRR